MALTHDFKETVKVRAQKDPKFRTALLTGAVECLLKGEADVAKGLLCDYVNATIGFKELGRLTDKKPQSLMRMLSASGNPSLDNISKLLASLHKHEGIEPHVSVLQT